MVSGSWFLLFETGLVFFVNDYQSEFLERQEDG